LLVPWAAAQNVAEIEDGELRTDQHAERLRAKRSPAYLMRAQHAAAG
jgi:hypothetical protein